MLSPIRVTIEYPISATALKAKIKAFTVLYDCKPIVKVSGSFYEDNGEYTRFRYAKLKGINTVYVLLQDYNYTVKIDPKSGSNILIILESPKEE